MTLGPEPGAERRAAPNVLPWIVALVAFALYTLTLNRWVSLFNLVAVAQTSGWIWHPALVSPAFFLVTYPFRWLPPPWIPLALNLLSAACAALALALLARSVKLLPQDRSEAQRLREPSDFSLLTIRAAWLPPVLAALICGLQLTFWERATNCTAEMFDLLLFAYVVRSLLEYRIDERESWLARAAFAYGLGMTDSWAMIGLLPAFVLTVLWIRGIRFFKLEFLVKLALCGLAGLSLYLLLPALASASGTISGGFWPDFWQALKVNLGSQASALKALARIPEARHIVALVSLTSLLPVGFMGIRWAASFGDSSRLGAALANFMFNLVHVVFLITCVWVAFDPSFSPRQKGLGLLLWYYLSALGVGYYSGYLLLVFGTQPERSHRIPPLVQGVNRAVVALVWLFLVLAPAGLICKNAPQIRATNSDIFRQYTARVEEGLPRGGGILLSDDARRLLLVQASLVRQGRAKDFLLVDTASLKVPDYHRFLHKQDPQRWTETLSRTQGAVTDLHLLKLLTDVSTNAAIYYLHPSFGYYFEHFYLEPHGLVYRLRPCPTNSLIPPLPAGAAVEENEAFWARATDEVFRSLEPQISPPAPSAADDVIDRWLRRAHLSREANLNALVAGMFYSRSLDDWGVTMQRLGQLDSAAKHFETALKLNPDNVVAQINLGFNRSLRAGNKTSPPLAKSVEDQFGRYRSWDDVIGNNGPFDEPNYCYEQGRVLFQNALYRQAAAGFARTRALSFNHALARIWLAWLYVSARQPDDALQVLRDFQDRPNDFALTLTNRNDLMFVEAAAHLQRNDLRRAQQLMETALKANPKDDTLFATALYVYEAHGYYSNALANIHDRLQTKPDDPALLVSQARVCARLGLNDETIQALTRLLMLQPDNYAALLERAGAWSRSDKPEMARQDYSRALAAVDQRLKEAPDDPGALMNEGVLSVNLGAYDRAIAALSRLLDLQPANDTARFNRAIASLRSDKLEAARQDYRKLEQRFPQSPQIQYGLAEIAYREKDTNTAIRHYGLYLANANTNTAESKFVSQRLQELKGSPP